MLAEPPAVASTERHPRRRWKACCRGPEAATLLMSAGTPHRAAATGQPGPSQYDARRGCSVATGATDITWNKIAVIAREDDDQAILNHALIRKADAVTAERSCATAGAGQSMDLARPFRRVARDAPTTISMTRGQAALPGASSRGRGGRPWTVGSGGSRRWSGRRPPWRGSQQTSASPGRPMPGRNGIASARFTSRRPAQANRAGSCNFARQRSEGVPRRDRPTGDLGLRVYRDW